MTVLSTLIDSSSVAAVTILPSASELATAWKRWYTASKNLSKLRFIRKRIAELGYMPAGQTIVDESEKDATNYLTKGSHGFQYHALSRTRRENGIYLNSTKERDYCAQVLGDGLNDDVDEDFWKR